MNAELLSRQLSARKIVAERLATNLIVNCERAASGRNGKRVNPALWNKTDWRHYVHVAARSPAILSLPALYRDIGDIETTLHEG
jgi:hypothetical protein